MHDRLLVIINPQASSGRGGRVAPKVLSALETAGVSHDVERTTAPRHATEIARNAASNGVGRVLVVGGDGTIHEVVTGLIESGAAELPSLAVFPVGTGNDFYRMVGAGKRAADVIAVLESGTVSRFDVGRVRWEGASGAAVRHFVNLLGVGVDVEVLRRREGFTRLSGLAQYLAALVSAITNFKPPTIELSVGETRLSGPTTICAVTVGPSIGGGFMLSPDATPSDGLLDLCHFPAMGFTRIVRLIPKVIRGTHGSVAEVTACQFESAVLASPNGTPLWFELDGELAPEPVTELHIDVLPGALPVLVPRHA